MFACERYDRPALRRLDPPRKEQVIYSVLTTIDCFSRWEYYWKVIVFKLLVRRNIFLGPNESNVRSSYFRVIEYACTKII